MMGGRGVIFYSPQNKADANVPEESLKKYFKSLEFCLGYWETTWRPPGEKNKYQSVPMSQDVLVLI